MISLIMLWGISTESKAATAVGNLQCNMNGYGVTNFVTPYAAFTPYNTSDGQLFF